MGPEASNHAAVFLIDSICLRQSFFPPSLALLLVFFCCCLSPPPSPDLPTACLPPYVLPLGKRILEQPERERVGEGEREGGRARQRVTK